MNHEVAQDKINKSDEFYTLEYAIKQLLIQTMFDLPFASASLNKDTDECELSWRTLM